MRVPASGNRTCTQQSVTKQFHTEAVWDHFRPKITQLYLDQGLILEDVRQEMERCCGFQASRKMYNIRIRRWGIKKNYLSAEKQQLIDELATDKADGVDRSPMINGRTVARMDKIERYLKMQRRQAARSCSSGSSLHSTSPAASQTDTLDEADVEECRQPCSLILRTKQDQDFQFSPESLFPKKSVPSSLGLCRYETVLHLWGKSTRIWIANSQAYQPMETFAFVNEQSYRLTNMWYLDVISSLVHVRRSLELHSKDDAVASLDKFCADLAAVLKTQYWPFVNQLIAETVSCLWEGFGEWRTYVYSFLVRMASTVLGNDHHTTQLFRLLADAEWVDNISVSMMRLEIDVLEQNQTTYLDHAYELIRDGINVFMWSGDVQAAKNYTHQHVARTQTVFGRNHWITHRALRILAFIYKRNDELLESREILIKLLQSDDLDSDYQDGSVIETSTDTLIFLADVCGRLGLFDECTTHLYRFLQVTAHQSGASSEEWCCRAFCLLSESLSRRHRIQELQNLPSLPQTVDAKRAQAWANVRLQYWPKSSV